MFSNAKFQNTNKYPYAAALVDSTSGSDVKCGATIIAPKYVITNANPCADKMNVANALVLVGSDDYNNS